jgi:hypothetical protein
MPADRLSYEHLNGMVDTGLWTHSNQSKKEGHAMFLLLSPVLASGLWIGGGAAGTILIIVVVVLLLRR